MYGINAVYKLAEIRRLRKSTPRRPHARASTMFPEGTLPIVPCTLADDTPPAQELSTLREMLHSHFVEEVRKRDRDGDGSLDRREYGGKREVFTQVDTDRDGLVDARDLMRVALDRNSELSAMVSGPWAPIYDRLLGVENQDAAQLGLAVTEGARQVHEYECVRIVAHSGQTGRSDYVRTPTTSADATETPVWEEKIVRAFLSHHGDLRNLHERLQNLADRLGRYRPYYRVDFLA